MIRLRTAAACSVPVLAGRIRLEPEKTKAGTSDMKLVPARTLVLESFSKNKCTQNLCCVFMGSPERFAHAKLFGERRSDGMSER